MHNISQNEKTFIWISDSSCSFWILKNNGKGDRSHSLLSAPRQPQIKNGYYGSLYRTVNLLCDILNRIITGCRYGDIDTHIGVTRSTMRIWDTHKFRS
jgi:hypothetical protein